MLGQHVSVSCERILFRKRVNKNVWTEEEENELRNLFDEFKESEGIRNVFTTIQAMA